MKPLFDLNGDGKTDMLEFLIATADDPGDLFNAACKNKDDDRTDEDDDEN